MDLNNILNQQQAAPAAPVAPVVNQAAAPQFGQPAPVVNQVVTPAVPATTAPANNLGGGSRLDTIKSALKSAKVGSKRNDIPLGSALYLLKGGEYKVTELNSTRLTNFSFICIKGIKDGQGVPFGGPGYTGAIPGEEYSTALFHDGPYAFPGLLKSLSACFGWGKDKIAEMQSDARLEQTIQLIDMFTCVGSVTQQPTNQPCCFSNQVILQMSANSKVSEVKVNGQPSYDAQGQKQTKTYTNTYWDKRMPIAEAVAGLAPEFIIKAFGTQEAITAALETEKQLDAFV